MMSVFLQEASQSQEEAQLPPFQSVLQLTAAHLPPKQQGAQTVDGEAEVEMRGESEAGHMLKDGKGTLADGSTWERISGEEFGDNGYWCRCEPVQLTQFGSRWPCMSFQVDILPMTCAHDLGHSSIL